MVEEQAPDVRRGEDLGVARVRERVVVRHAFTAWLVARESRRLLVWYRMSRERPPDGGLPVGLRAVALVPLLAVQT